MPLIISVTDVCRYQRILEVAGRFEEAGEVAVQEKETDRAVELFQKAGSPSSYAKASDTLRSELYSILPFGMYKVMPSALTTLPHPLLTRPGS